MNEDQSDLQRSQFTPKLHQCVRYGDGGGCYTDRKTIDTSRMVISGQNIGYVGYFKSGLEHESIGATQTRIIH